MRNYKVKIIHGFGKKAEKNFQTYLNMYSKEGWNILDFKAVFLVGVVAVFYKDTNE